MPANNGESLIGKPQHGGVHFIKYGDTCPKNPLSVFWNLIYETKGEERVNEVNMRNTEWQLGWIPLAKDSTWKVWEHMYVLATTPSVASNYFLKLNSLSMTSTHLV